MVPPALMLIGGILLAHYFSGLSPRVWLWTMAACAAILSVLLLAKRDMVQRIVVLTTVLFCGLLGGFLCSMAEEHHWSRHCPDNAFLEVTLRETPSPGAKTYKTTAEVVGHSGDITLSFKKDSTSANLRYGDRLLIHGYPDTVRNTMYVTSIHYLLLDRDSASLRARSEEFRIRLLHRMEQGSLPAKLTGIVAALTLGWKADLWPETKVAFRDAGIAHLLAVSGLHVGLLAYMAGLLLIWLGKDRRGRMMRGGVQVVVVWLFAMLTGMAPATIRAALMFSLFIVSDITGRRTPKMNILAVAAIITLIGKPMLLFDTGWQLSYCAVAGIILARPIITAFHNRIWQAANVSIAATVATLPVTLLTFGRFHPYFLIANVIIIPFSAIILAFALLYMAMPCAITAWPLELVLNVTECLTEWVASLPGAVIQW